MVYNQGFDRILLKNVEIITCDFCDFTYLLLITKSRSCVMFAQRLFYFNGKCIVRNAHRLAKKIISMRLFFDVSSATCVATLERNSINITSIAFHRYCANSGDQ